MKRHSFTKFIALSAVASLSCQTAFAGLSDMVNDFFTFREEQKDLIRPNYTLPPKHVIVPYYDEAEGAKWSEYYTRQDIQATPNMDNSSMVMRPSNHKNPYFQAEKANIEHRNEIQQPARHFTGHNDIISHNQPQGLGFEAIQRRDHQNKINNLEGNVYIGDPGSAPHLQHNAGANIGQKTRIGAPVKAWNDRTPERYADARPGDFDYKNNFEIGAYSDVETVQKQRLNRHSGYSENTARTFVDAPVHSQNEQNLQQQLPTQYIVQPQDSLSGISDKDRIYGDWKLWPIIYDANKGQINDPDLIHPQQRLDIPRNSSKSQQNSARMRAMDKNPPYSFYDGK